MELPFDDARSKRLDALSAEALEGYVDKLKREKLESKSWIAQPSNLISLVAIVLSLLGVTYQFYKDYKDSQDKHLTALSTAVADLLKLEIEVASKPGGAPGNFTTNRRITLLAEADRLATELGNLAPPDQLAFLGPEYAQVGDNDRAIKYLMLMTTNKSKLVQQGGWRSIGATYFLNGAAGVNPGREAYAKGARIFENPANDAEKNLEMQVLEQWANDEFNSGHYREAMAQYIAARKVAGSRACSPARASDISRLDRQGIESARRGSPSIGPSPDLVWAEPNDGRQCNSP